MSAPGQQQNRGQRQTVRYIDGVEVIITDDFDGAVSDQEWQRLQQERMELLQKQDLRKPRNLTTLASAQPGRMSDTSYIQSISDFEDGDLTSGSMNPGGLMPAETIPLWQLRGPSTQPAPAPHSLGSSNFEQSQQYPNVATLGAVSSAISFAPLPSRDDHSSLLFSPTAFTPINASMPHRFDSPHNLMKFDPSPFNEEPVVPTSTVHPSTLTDTSQPLHQYASELFPDYTGIIGTGEAYGQGQSVFGSSFSTDNSGFSPSSQVMTPDQFTTEEERVLSAFSNPPQQYYPGAAHSIPSIKGASEALAGYRKISCFRHKRGTPRPVTTQDHTADDWFHHEPAPVPTATRAINNTRGHAVQAGSYFQPHKTAHLSAFNGTVPEIPFMGSFAGPLHYTRPTAKVPTSRALNRFSGGARIVSAPPRTVPPPPSTPTPQRTPVSPVHEKLLASRDLTPGQEGLQETPARGRARTRASRSHSASLAEVAPPRSRDRQDIDEYIVRSKSAGLTYREIKIHGGLDCAESTIRGRFRNLTKDPSQRLRKPVWTDIDIALLKDEVHRQTRDAGRAMVHPGRIAWKEVAFHIIENGGTYLFGNATCKRKWVDLTRQNAASSYIPTDENTPAPATATEPDSSSSGQDALQSADQPSLNTHSEGEGLFVEASDFD